MLGAGRLRRNRGLAPGLLLRKASGQGGQAATETRQLTHGPDLWRHVAGAQLRGIIVADPMNQPKPDPRTGRPGRRAGRRCSVAMHWTPLIAAILTGGEGSASARGKTRTAQPTPPAKRYCWLRKASCCSKSHRLARSPAGTCRHLATRKAKQRQTTARKAIISTRSAIFDPLCISIRDQHLPQHRRFRQQLASGLISA